MRRIHYRQHSTSCLSDTLSIIAFSGLESAISRPARNAGSWECIYRPWLLSAGSGGVTIELYILFSLDIYGRDVRAGVGQERRQANLQHWSRIQGHAVVRTTGVGPARTAEKSIHKDTVMLKCRDQTGFGLGPGLGSRTGRVYIAYCKEIDVRSVN